jgi:hypothetical protein
VKNRVLWDNNRVLWCFFKTGWFGKKRVLSYRPGGLGFPQISSVHIQLSMYIQRFLELSTFENIVHFTP